jgi:hypothetical protein
MVATYSGDAGNAGSASTTLSQVINSGGKATSTTTLTSSRNPSIVGGRVTFTARVTGNAPTGTVAFTDGANIMNGCNAVPLVRRGRVVTPNCRTRHLTVGTHNIGATYSGDAANNGSSAILSQVVNP